MPLYNYINFLLKGDFLGNLLAVVADTFPDRAFVVLVSPKTAAAFPDADAAKFESAPNPPTAALFKLSFG